MSATIVDLVDYGDTKGRDFYGRNSFHSVKGDGLVGSSLTQGFYGIQSGSTTDYELARLTASEGAVDNETGTFTISVNDGASSVNDILSLSDTASTITTTTFTMAATDIFATGTLNVGVLEQAELAEGARIELVDDASAALTAINFVMGTTAPSTPLIITEDEVAVGTGITLSIGGVDVLDAITGGNPWDTTGTPVVALKTEYTSVEINDFVGHGHSTSLALDVNGTMRLRGNDLLFYDQPLDAHYSTLAFDEASQNVILRSSRASDSLVLQTSNGTSNIYLDRLTFTDGLATQEAYFTNTQVGIGILPGTGLTGTWELEVAGSGSFTGGLVTGADIDLAGNNLINVTSLISDTSVVLDTELASINLTSSATDAQIDLIVGTASPVTAATFTPTTATIPLATTIASLTVTGDLQVDGTTTTFNTSTVTVDDINIDLGVNTDTPITTKAAMNGGGITLGAAVTDYVGAIPSIAYDSTLEVWDMSIGLNLDAGALTVGTTTVGDTDVTLLSDTAYIYLGATQQWRLGMYIDGSGDHFEIAHDDLGTQTTWVTKLDVLE